MNELGIPSSTWEMLLRIAIAFGLGLVVGIERQWRARMAGLRTNVLVSVGSALFVLFGAYAFEGSAGDPTRVAAQIVSGIGFLGAGVIWRQGGSISGLNTAATLWTTAAVGALAGGGLYLVAFGGAATVVVANTVLRPIARTINRQPSVGDGVVTHYVLELRCRGEDEDTIRELAIDTMSSNGLRLTSVSAESDPAAPDFTTIRAVARGEDSDDRHLEAAVGALSRVEGVRAATWSAHEHAPSERR